MIGSYFFYSNVILGATITSVVVYDHHSLTLILIPCSVVKCRKKEKLKEEMNQPDESSEGEVMMSETLMRARSGETRYESYPIRYHLLSIDVYPTYLTTFAI